MFFRAIHILLVLLSAVSICSAAPEIVVSNMLEIVDGDTTPTRSAGTDFGSAQVGSPRPRRTFTVHNAGTNTLTTGSLSVPSGFSIVEALSSSISTGAFDSFTVALETSSTGTFAGDVSFSNNDTDENPFNFAITGRVNPAGSNVTLVTPIADILVEKDALPTEIDLLQHFDDIGVDGTVVRIETVLGNLDIELTDHVTPVTAANFLNYVQSGRYTDMFIHRSATNFVIQGGGFTYTNDIIGIRSVPTDPPIVNEFSNWFDSAYGNLAPGTPINVRGTVAMAKTTNSPDTATSQWFVNLKDNAAILDDQNGGFTVFGTVINGCMGVVDLISWLYVETIIAPPFNALPVRDYSGYPPYKSNLVICTRAAVMDELALTVTGNDNPAIVTPTIDAEGILTLTYTADTMGVANITISATDLGSNTVEDTFQIAVREFDFGDAPAPYPTLRAADGAMHAVTDLELGALIDPELDGQPAVDAKGDDAAGLADEDGVSMATPFVRGTNAVIDFTTSHTDAYLNAWIDYSRDGDWADLGEHIVNDFWIQATSVAVTTAVPVSAGVGETFLRTRLSTQSGLSPTGLAPDGEVEDYRVTLLQAQPPVPLVITNVDLSIDSSVTVRWQADGETICQLYSATNLNSSGNFTWTEVGTPCAGLTVQTDTGAVGAVRLYRIAAPFVAE